MEIKLSDFTIPRLPVPLPGKGPGGEKQHFMVRGLCADDLTLLVSLHHGPITKALLSYQEQRERIMGDGARGMTQFLVTLARDFPDLVAEVISVAADSMDEKTRGKAAKLPFTTQLAALNAIVSLSMEEVSGLKNLLAEMRDRLASASRK